MGAPSTASSAPTPTGLAVIQPPVHSSTAGPSSAAAAKKKRAWNPSGESTSQKSVLRSTSTVLRDRVWRQGQIKAASIIIGVNTEFSKVACSTSLQHCPSAIPQSPPSYFNTILLVITGISRRPYRYHAPSLYRLSLYLFVPINLLITSLLRSYYARPDIYGAHCRLIGMVRLSPDPLATFEAIFKSAHMHYFTNSSVVFYEYNWRSAAPPMELPRPHIHIQHQGQEDILLAGHLPVDTRSKKRRFRAVEAPILPSDAPPPVVTASRNRSKYEPRLTPLGARRSTRWNKQRK
ncbi:hypothetical protein B0H14DRAFT_2583818 [Mycena olivaceomarginata]|nr:hypothetical protein B0H14DRAFT_2583818 [Mycena olivaceomarginata]